MILSLLCSSNIIFAFVNFGQLFMSITPPHWCASEVSLDTGLKLGLNWTEKDVIRWTIPPAKKRKGFSHCKMYDINITQTLLDGTRNINHSWPTTNCSQKWNYNFTLHHPTITSEFNWVCEQEKLHRVAKILFHIGCIFGAAVFGLFADLFGRKKTLLMANFVGGLFGILSALSTSFWQFGATRFIVGLTHYAETATLYILLMEYSPVALRTLITNLPVMICFTGGMCAMPMLSYVIHDWRNLGVFIGVCQLLHFCTLWILPESARWLVITRQEDDAMTAIQWMAKVNRIKLSFFQTNEVKAFIQRHRGEKSGSVMSSLGQSKWTLLSLAIASIAINVVFEGFTIMAQEISKDYYFTFTVMGAVELPAGILTVAMVEWAGRRPALVWSLATSAMGAFLMTSVSKADVMFATIAERFVLTVGVNSHLQFVAESASTDVRAFSCGLIHSAGLTMALGVVPVVKMFKSIPWLAYVVFGWIAVIGAAVSLKIDETRNKRLPDISTNTIEDGTNAAIVMEMDTIEARVQDVPNF